MSQKKIYYLFSSITFLQFYIPLVIEANNRSYKNIFILRQNYKEYANPLSKTNLPILETYLKKYQIKIKIADQIDLTKIKGIVFMIDGDIYGPPRKQGLDESLLFKLDEKKILAFSMTEHMNFWTVYHHFIDKVKYCSFSNPLLVDQINKLNLGSVDLGGVIVDTTKSYQSDKNIYLGNTKLDNIPEKEEIYRKFNLNQKEKYCLFLFPKIRTQFTNENLLNIYNHLKNLGFKIIVKTRPKDPPINKDLQGDYFVSSDIYPNESLQLMKISELCLISSSSANEETIYSKIPCIDLESDLRAWDRNSYLLDNKTYIKLEIDQWKNISFHDFNNYYKKLEKKDSSYFTIIKEKYLFSHNSSSEKIFDFLENNDKEYF